jgi:DNA-binding transcriptional regulator YdaS (Cro superfamily)
MTTLKQWRLSLAEPTLAAAGKLLGISDAQMQRLETGKRPVTAEMAKVIEEKTGIPRYELRPDIFGPAPTSSPQAAA